MTGRAVADLLAAKMLLNNLRGGLTTPLAHRQVTPNGAAFELYQPKRTRKTIVFVYGLLLQGEHDPRIVQFARAMASAGARVVVPVLSGMKSFVVEQADRDALMDILKHINQDGKPVAILAISAGACLALCPSDDFAPGSYANSIILISPVYDLRTAWTSLHDPTLPRATDSPAWQGYIWKQCAIAYRNRKTLGLSEEILRQLEDVLQRYDNGLTPHEKVNFYKTRLLPLKMHECEELLAENDAQQTLTPRGKLNRIKSRVIILHGAHDPIVPPEHARQMMAELERRDRAHGQDLFITSILSHEQLQGTYNLRDLLRFIHLMGELYT